MKIKLEFLKIARFSRYLTRSCEWIDYYLLAPSLPLESNDEMGREKEREKSHVGFSPPEVQSQNETESNKVDLIIKFAQGVSVLFAWIRFNM